MMMTNFVLDISVFAFPPKSNDPAEERANITAFRKDLEALVRLLRNPRVSFSMGENVTQLLENKGRYFNPYNPEQRGRLNAAPPSLLDDNYLHAFYHTIQPKKKKDEKKQLGQKYPEDFGYYPVYLENNCAYLNKQWDKEEVDSGSLPFQDQEFGKSVIKHARINRELQTQNSRFLVVKGDLDQRAIPVKLTSDGTEETVMVRVIGIQKTAALLKSLPEQNLSVNTLTGACELIYSHSQNRNGSFLKRPFPFRQLEKNEHYGPPCRFYLYLDTLLHISAFLQKQDQPFPDDEIQNEIEVEKLLHFAGCDCTRETPARESPYRQQQCRYRKDFDGSKESFFELHLKPVTNDLRYGTLRVYFKWNQALRSLYAGIICKHLHLCCNGERPCPAIADTANPCRPYLKKCGDCSKTDCPLCQADFDRPFANLLKNEHS